MGKISFFGFGDGPLVSAQVLGMEIHAINRPREDWNILLRSRKAKTVIQINSFMPKAEHRTRIQS